MNQTKMKIRRVVKRAVKEAFAQPSGDKRDEMALMAFDDFLRYADELTDVYRNGVTPQSVDESSAIVAATMNQIGGGLRAYQRTDDRYDIFENLQGIFMPFKDYMGQYLSDPSRYQGVMEKSVDRALATLTEDIETEKKAFQEYLAWEAEGEARANNGKSFIFRGKAMTVSAVKSEMTQEIVSAFDNYENQVLEVDTYDDKGELQKKKKKYQIADELGELLDSVSVDPSTGEVELVMSNLLPAEHIGGAPFPLPEDEEYEGFPVVEWRDPDVIQKWIDQNLKNLIIVKNVKPEGSTANLVQGVWNGDIPVGMNVVGGQRSLSMRAVRNIITARTVKAMYAKILRIRASRKQIGVKAEDRFITEEEVQDAIDFLIRFARSNPQEFDIDTSYFDELYMRLVSSLRSLLPETAGRETELDYSLRMAILDILEQAESILTALKEWNRDEINPELSKMGNVKELATAMIKKFRRLIATENFKFRQDHPSEVFPK